MIITLPIWCKLTNHPLLKDKSKGEGEALSASDGNIDDGIDDTDWKTAHQNLDEAEQTSSKTWAEFHTHLTLSLGLQVT